MIALPRNSHLGVMETVKLADYAATFRLTYHVPTNRRVIALSFDGCLDVMETMKLADLAAIVRPTYLRQLSVRYNAHADGQVTSAIPP